MEESYKNLLRTLDSFNDVEFKKEMFEGIVDSFEQCSKLFENCQTRFLKPINKRAETNFDKEEEDEIKASDSASQTGVRTSIVSKKSDFAQQIEFERKRTEIESTEEIAKARKTRLLAEAEACEVEAHAQARKARLLAEAEEAESLAKLRLEKANLEAEEKLAAFEGSSILSTSTTIKSFSSLRSRARRNISNLRVKSENAAKSEHCAEQRIETEPMPVKPKVPIVRKRLVKTTELKPHEVMNRFNDLCLNDMVPENVQMFGSRDWQTTASRQVFNVNVNRGGVEDTRLEAKAKDTKKIRGQGQGQGQPFRGQTLSRPRTGMLEAKDQGHKAQVLSKKKKKKKRSSQKFFKRSSLKNVFQKFFNRSTKF